MVLTMFFIESILIDLKSVKILRRTPNLMSIIEFKVLATIKAFTNSLRNKTVKKVVINLQRDYQV